MAVDLALSGVRTAVIYAGGFLGPFTAVMSNAILPELADTYGITPEHASAALVAYMVPFSSIMLVSGALGRRWGLTRTITTAYGLIALASMVVAIAPTWEVFLLGLILCGGLNAFTTPLLLTLLNRITRPERVGSAVGRFAACQSGGILLGPFVSGLFATSSWRFAFVLVAGLAGVMFALGLPRVEPERKPWPELFAYFRSRWTFLMAGAVLVMSAGTMGLVSVIVLFGTDRWDLGSVERGLIVMLGGAAGIIVATPVGWLIDRVGAMRMTQAGIVMGIVALVPVPFAPNPVVFAALWCLITGAGQVMLVSAMAVVMKTPGTASSISVIHAARFGGLALAPLVVVPLYAVELGSVQLGAVVLCAAGTLAVALVVLNLAQSSRPRQEAPPVL